VRASCLVSSLAAAFVITTAHADAQTGAVDSDPPTPIERALTERTCAARPTSSLADLDAQQRCIDGQVSVLRNDFGRDLRRLSAAERKAVDAACSRREATHGREGYLDCINAQLSALRARRTPVTAAQPAVAATSLATAVVVVPPAVVPDTTTSGSRGSLAVAALAAVFIAGVGAGSVVTLRHRRRRRTCHRCGVAIFDGGDLCAPCRRAAADALRSAAADRMEQARANRAERHFLSR
jgi:hypothetical protein